MKEVDELVIVPVPRTPPKGQYAHVRCSAANFAEVERLAHLCNMNNRVIVDMLMDFAIKRVKLIERPLYEMGFQELGEDDEGTEQ